MNEIEEEEFDFNDLIASKKYPEPEELIDFIPGQNGCEVLFRGGSQKPITTSNDSTQSTTTEGEEEEESNNNNEDEQSTPTRRMPIRRARELSVYGSPQKQTQTQQQNNSTPTKQSPAKSVASSSPIQTNKRSRSTLRCCYVPSHIVTIQEEQQNDEEQPNEQLQMQTPSEILPTTIQQTQQTPPETVPHRCGILHESIQTSTK